MIVAIILNSEINVKINGEYFIAVDGGLRELIKQGIKPNLILGDFDSFDLKKNIYPDVERVKYKKNKNFSDGEAAILEAKKRGFQKVYLYGIDGGRIDHIYCNIALIVFGGRNKLDIEGRGDNFKIIYYSQGIKGINVSKGDIVSIFPSSDSLITSSKNLLYKYDNKSLDYKNISLGLSNIATADYIEIEIEKGDGLIFVTKE